MLIAGPNGAGKTTSANLLLPETTPYVNADNIARNLPPRPGRSLDVEAGRRMLQEVDRLLKSGSDVAVETTLAARSFVRRVLFAKQKGYQVWLIFLWLPSPDLAIARVAQRVESGGHSVPEPVIRRRYCRGIQNFFRLYRAAVDGWRFYDSSPLYAPKVIATRLPGQEETVLSPEVWDKIMKESNL